MHTAIQAAATEVDSQAGMMIAHNMQPRVKVSVSAKRLQQG